MKSELKVITLCSQLAIFDIPLAVFFLTNPHLLVDPLLLLRCGKVKRYAVWSVMNSVIVLLLFHCPLLVLFFLPPLAFSSDLLNIRCDVPLGNVSGSRRTSTVVVVRLQTSFPPSLPPSTDILTVTCWALSRAVLPYHKTFF